MTDTGTDPEADAGGEARAGVAAPDAAGGAAHDEEPGSEGPSSAEYSIAFSPRNVAVGLAIVAGLVAIAARRHRRGRRDGA
jgi:hypothetical protein